MPSPQQVQRAVELLGRSTANCTYFFARLDDPTWIDPLAERRILKDPPDLVSDGTGRIHPTHIWPQADYLKRMAKKKDSFVQKQVLGVMLDVGATNNYFIHAEFAEAALAMPSDLAAQWAEHEVGWLGKGNQMKGFLELNLGKLISKLAKEGKPDVALRLATELLAVLPDPEEEKKRHLKSEVERLAYSSLQPSTRCDRYSFEQVLKENIPDLAESAPFQTLDLLCSLLQDAVLFSQREGEKDKPDDNSHIWRPAIEDHKQNHDYTIDGPLITAVRDTAEGICRRNPEKTGKVVERIESHGWDVFRRIGLHLLRVAANPPKAMVAKRLVNKEFFDHPGVHHEYFHLIKVRFGELAPEDQSTILGWIETASDEKELLAEHESDLTEGQKAKRIKYWQYRKLRPIQEYLTGEWKQRFNALKSELREPEIPPDFHMYTSSWRGGPESPKKPEELSEMTAEELVSYLKTWRASGDWMAPTPDGLGSTLGGLVAEQPERYAHEVERFMAPNIDPTYVRHLISGFCRALESDRSVPFGPVFRLCNWVVDQPTDIAGRTVPQGLRDGFDVDKNWCHARREIARFIEKSLEEKTHLPFECREAVWAIILPLTDDPEPDGEYEKKYGGDNMDPLTLSLNTIRGKALHAVMSYAMWVCRNIEGDVRARENRTPSLREMPEVLDVLERHLDPTVDNSQTSRAVYGQWLPQLVHLSPEWVKTSLSRLFPSKTAFKPLREAVWHTYLLYVDRLYSAVIKIMVGIYREEVLGLKGRDIRDNMYKSPEARLAEHVMMLYLWGYCGLEDNSLIDLFFRSAPVQLTAHAMDFIGRSTWREEAVKSAILVRMKALWGWRVKRVGGPDNMPREELAAFGWWFAGGQFDAGWALGHLEETLQRTGVSQSSLYVFGHMSTVFPAYPQKSLRCLRLFIDRNADPWFFRSTRKQKGVWTLLEQAMNSEDAGIQDQAEEIVHLLGSKGYLEYRDLLKSRERQKDDARP